MNDPGYPLAVIAEAVGGTLLDDPGDLRVRHLSIDSRVAAIAEGTLFIALKGARHDGHGHMAEMAGKGVHCFMIGSAAARLDRPGCAHILVNDTHDALQRLAAWHRGHFRIPVIGITGSNGKTVVKEWLFQMLQGSGNIVRSPGSWNSQVGVPLSVWEMRAEHDLAIFEAGISKPGEMAHLRSIIRPAIGVFTNIGPAHGENFKNELEKSLEKIKLFQDAGALIHCADHPAVVEALRRTGLEQRLKLRGWSRERDGWLHVVREEVRRNGTAISVLNDQVEFTFEIPFTDKASIENALHCVTLLLHMGHDPQWIMSRTAHLTPVAMRLEVVDGTHGIKLINDAYSNDLASLRIALDHLGVVGAGTRKVVVLSEMLGSGTPAGMLSGRIADLLSRSAVDLLIAVGFDPRATGDAFKCEVRYFPDVATMLEKIDPASLAGSTVLVKGARAFALEQVVQRWERKVHGTVLEIDLDAIRHNLNHYRSRLSPGVRIMAMVKAFGYGSGALELARLFAHEQVHYLGVAYGDEGLELRRNGIQLPILVMNPEPVSFQVLHSARLEAEVYDMRTLSEALAFAQVHPAELPVHLKLDTGMHRLGFTAEEMPALLDALKDASSLMITSLFSHLVASEDPASDAFTKEQIAQFESMCGAIAEVIGYMPLRHIANSAAIGRFPHSQFDMVRLGIGLHGIGADAVESAQLIPATSLRSPVAQIKRIAAGRSIGYGRSFIAEKEMTIAILPIGYADGFARRLGNGRGRVWIKGLACPVVGNVCMDMCMVDITGLDVKIGDEAYVFNEEHPITELAADLGTIPYEVLTSISQRVKRVHVHE
jgi:Alr-MurF fusion protein